MTAASTRRCFFALPLDQACRDDLVQALAEVDVPGMRRVASENLHLTVKFLGDTEDTLLPSILTAMNDLAAKRAGFDLQVVGALWLPSERRPRILAAECRAEPALLQLAGDIDVAMNDLGFPLEGRDFLPHITLGRMKKPPSAPLPDVDLPPTGCRVSRIVLYESLLLPTGPQYSALAHWPLA